MILKAEKLTKEFMRKRNGANYFTAVDNFSIELNPSSITMIMGDSGKGKTTILNMLSGLLKPNNGTVLLDDTNLYELNDEKLSELRFKHFGIIPQGQTLLRSLTVIDNVLLPLSIYGIKITDEHIKKAEDLLDKLGVLDLKDIYPSEMSGGELRRCAIARALINDPEFIFADEPTSDLDQNNRKIVMDMFKLIKSEGKSVFIITHDDAIKDEADNLINI